MSAPCVQLEILNADGEWVTAGSVSIDEPPGSISSELPGGTRHVYLFGWHVGECGVWQSMNGIDVGNSAVRRVVSTELSVLSHLHEPFELTTYRQGQPRHLRFTRRN